MDTNRAVIQCDIVGWKVVTPTGKVKNKLTLEQAAAALMEWNFPNAHNGKHWWEVK